MSAHSHRLPSRRAPVAEPRAASRFRPHPWHGLEVGPDPPEVLNAFIEITPFDLVKYEVDKISGYLRVDRPQRSSAQHPSLYGFVPRTYCGERVRRLQSEGETQARLYGADDSDGVGGMGALFLLLDEPEVYGLPPDPVSTTRDVRSMWKAAAVAAAGLLGAVVAAFR